MHEGSFVVVMVGFFLVTSTELFWEVLDSIVTSRCRLVPTFDVTSDNGFLFSITFNLLRDVVDDDKAT